MQQLALVMQDLANHSNLSQLGSGTGVFDVAGLSEALAQAPVIAVEVRADRLGQLEVSIAATGPVRLFTPQAQTPPASKPEVNAPEVLAGEPSVVYAHPDASSAPFSAANVARAFSYSGIVFGQPQLAPSRTDHLPQSLIPSRAGDAPVARESERSAGTPAEAGRRAAPAPSRPGEAAPQAAPSLPSASLRHVSSPVRELLAQLQLLPPGARSEDVLPRLQEVVRLWNQETARNSDLPPDVVRAVNHFLASAVLSVALAEPRGGQTVAARSDQAQAQPQPRGDSRDGAPSNPLFAASPTSLSASLSGARIAEVVRNVLFAAQAPQSAPTVQAQPQAQPLPQQGQRSPSMGPGPAAGASGPQAQPAPTAPPKAEGMVRIDPATGRPLAREEVREPRVVVRADVGPAEGRGESPSPEVISQGAYEREAHEETAYVPAQELEAVWPRLLESLRAAGYVSEGALRALRNTDDARSFLAVVSTFVPARFDLVDVLEMAGSKIGLSGASSPLNAALERAASYRGRRGVTKESALMEPIQDAMSVLFFGLDSASEEEMDVLRRFEAHLPVVEAFLEHPDWIDRLDGRAFEDAGNKRESLVKQLDEARNLHRTFAGKNRLPAPSADAPRLLH